MADPLTTTLLILSALTGGAAALNQPKTPNQGAGLPAGTGTGQGFTLPQVGPPLTTGGVGDVIAGASAAPGIDFSTQNAVVDAIAKAAAAQGEPPTVPLQPAEFVGPPEAPRPPKPEKPPKEPATIGEVLAASPDAIAAVAALLGLNQPNNPDRAAPIPAGTRGSVVGGFDLPQVPAIGQLLAQIPRFR